MKIKYIIQVLKNLICLEYEELNDLQIRINDYISSRFVIINVFNLLLLIVTVIDIIC